MQKTPAFVSPSYFRYGMMIAAIALLLDQCSKYMILHVMELERIQPVALTPFFNLILVWNRGISFGLFNDHSNRWASLQPWLLSLMALLIVGILLAWLKKAQNRLFATAVGLVIGGAAGNILDRILYGAVADFLDFHVVGWHWPAFNVADAAICVGVAILCWDSMFGGVVKRYEALQTKE